MAAAGASPERGPQATASPPPTAAALPQVYWPPPPPKQGFPTWAIVLVVVVVIVVVMIVLAAVLYVMVTGLLGGPGPPPPNRPVVAFAQTSPIPNGFEFEVAATSQAVGSSNYQMTLQVNATAGTTVTLSAAMSFTIGANTYSMTWTDIGGEGDLTGGDQFRVTRAGGLLPNTDYTVRLLWIDGSQVQSAQYSSP